MSALFKRLEHADWVSLIPVFATLLLLVIFIGATYFALRMKPSDRKHLASLPLDND